MAKFARQESVYVYEVRNFIVSNPSGSIRFEWHVGDVAASRLYVAMPVVELLAPSAIAAATYDVAAACLRDGALEPLWQALETLHRFHAPVVPER